MNQFEIVALMAAVPIRQSSCGLTYVRAEICDHRTMKLLQSVEFARHRNPASVMWRLGSSDVDNLLAVSAARHTTAGSSNLRTMVAHTHRGREIVAAGCAPLVVLHSSGNA